MKILVVGHNTTTREAFAAKIREHYPDAEIVFSEDLPNPEEGQRSDPVWFDELSEFVMSSMEWLKEFKSYNDDFQSRSRLNRQNPYGGNRPWSRRKNR